MTKKQRQTLLSGIFFTLFSIFVLICTTGVEVKHLGGDMGSAFLPYIVSVLVCICGVFVIVSTLIQSRKVTEVSEEKNTNTEDTRSVYLGLASFVIYAALLKPLGFIVSSFLFLVALMNIMAPKRPTKKDEIFMLVLSFAVPAVVSVIFVHLLHVTLPAGILAL